MTFAPAAAAAQPLAYRPDIDGLRAIAIAAVVLFHAHVPGFRGGFAGVDVFFVISGYLIAAWVQNLSALRADWIAEFYRRRILRLLPAAAVVLACTAVAACWLLLPRDLEAYSGSLAATAALGANVWFWHEAGYFASPSGTKPLLHMWSLAIEQQFYLLYPPLMLMASRLRWRPATVVAGFAALSFGLALWATSLRPGVAFYWTPVRLWELLLGSWIALALPPLPASVALRKLLALAGLGAIVLASVAYDFRTPWPGLAALLPCGGAALLIWLGQEGGTPTHRLLAARPMVAIGLASYSIYLWHWPLLALARYWKVEPLDAVETGALVALALALSALTWRWVEQPARRAGRALPRRTLLGGSVAVLAVLGAAGLAGVAAGGWPARVPDYARYLAQRSDYFKTPCDARARPADSEECVLGAHPRGEFGFMIWGDSHANSFAPAADEAGRTLGRSGLLATAPVCPPVLDAPGIGRQEPRCLDLKDKALGALRPDMVVFMAGYWLRYERGPMASPGQQPRGIEEVELQASRAGIEQGLRQAVRAVRAAGALPVLVGPVPEFLASVPDLALRKPALTRVARSSVDARTQFTRDLLSRVAVEEGARYLPLLDLLCDAQACDGVLDGKVLFFDDDHLSTAGARRLAPLVVPLLRDAPAPLRGVTSARSVLPGVAP